MAKPDERFDMTDGTCSLAECDKPIKRAGFCYGHYMKNWRYGTPTPGFAPSWVDIQGQQFGHLRVTDRVGMFWLCACDCGAQAKVRTGDLNRGTVTTCGNKAEHWRRDDIGYSMAHDRVRTDRGRVQEHACVDCAGAAEHWSYDHNDPNEMYAEGLSARPVAYSADPIHYSPRCAKCHKRYDLGRIDANRVA